ncbi:MAG: PAS domain-containing protein [Desulfobacterales bacterium]|nr:PAS domain-containing protein [Desulfobacterales bacterium]
MNKPLSQDDSYQISEADRRRRKRERILMILIPFVVAALTYAENRVIHFGADFPISNTILMFILININLLLLILLLFLVFRNLVKLLYDRKRRLMGARLRTRLVAAFVALTLLPTIVLFFFSINFITNSIEFWFNVPVEQALENSLVVGRRLYGYVDENNRFYLERIAYQVKIREFHKPEKQKGLSRYIQVVQRAFNLHAVEIYGPNLQRLSYAMADELQERGLEALDAEQFQKRMTPDGFRTLTVSGEDGEMIRTICAVPFGAAPDEAQAYAVVSVLVPPDLAEDLTSISRGFEEYQQIKLLKEPIRATYYITLSIVGLLVVFCAIWFGFTLAKTITIPIMELAEGTRRVAEGDLKFAISPAADDEIGSLVESFNKMTQDLRIGREQLELSAKKLREQNLEIEERRRYMEIVLRNISTGVITLDKAGKVSTLNKSAERMLNLKAERVLNASYKTVLRGEHLALAKEVTEKITRSPKESVELPLRVTVDGRPRSFLVNISALQDDAGRHMGIVMVFDDLTELEKAQRMAAWREVARRIAHEVKNPLTPISLSAQRLKRRFSDRVKEPVFDECTQTIIDHVELIRNLVNEFSAFARFPTADPKPCDLPPVIDETVALYRESHPHIDFRIEVEDRLPLLNLDRQQIKQALINLIDNAIAAIRRQGTVWLTASHDPLLKRVRLTIADDGAGIADQDKNRLFEPNFSTKKAGMGLGLTIVSTIVQDHEGLIRVEDNSPRGARFVIELPY